MLYRFYAIVGTVFFVLVRPLAPLVPVFGPRFAYGLAARMGRYQDSARAYPAENKRRSHEEKRTSSKEKRIWFHAASVGEVQAAVNLIGELEGQGEQHFFLTVTTEQGHRVAEQKLSGRATCLMAPFDVPFVVRRTLRRIRPDLFICVETELWPALLMEIHRAGVKMSLVNGRMSERSFGRYQLIKGLMQQLLAGFSAVAVIGPEDRDRFAALGVAEECIRVSGNSKYAHPAVKRQQVRNLYRKQLGLQDATVFICGSTRSGEEELLIPVYEQLRRQGGKRLVWIIAPRHLERIPALQALCSRRRLDTVLLSDCREGSRAADIIVVDTMGELADLYAAGDFNFCGGSLVGRGGHNIMEIVRWGLPVYFGPHMEDFRDAVRLVLPAGAGFQVADAGELADVLNRHLGNRELYEQACRAAEELSALQCKAVAQQAKMVRGLLNRQSAGC